MRGQPKSFNPGCNREYTCLCQGGRDTDLMRHNLGIDGAHECACVEPFQNLAEITVDGAQLGGNLIGYRKNVSVGKTQVAQICMQQWMVSDQLCQVHARVLMFKLGVTRYPGRDNGNANAASAGALKPGEAGFLQGFYKTGCVGHTRCKSIGRQGGCVSGTGPESEVGVWVQTPDIDGLNALHKNTAVSHLGIEITAVGADSLSGRMPVDERTRQPFGLLHGGASALLLETLASAASNHCVDEAHMCVGLEINCNHLRGATSGWVHGRARALRIGRTSMVWDLEATDEQGRAVTAGRLTAMVVPKPG